MRLAKVLFGGDVERVWELEPRVPIDEGHRGGTAF
eukprot:CAMPEP_0175893702 /NCGR_PEP_ID=MMETSP0107_2-20121207/49604_1 /TAXON_ID=195067 ORGANISM="Goniomonas pacifica, Strain CCMP1869" /NCGR_SAMPLE_ID=MMETSP0107_2 /ASSEMBLY_ACC=CAM_ASM_000203 /LENGTH=34 /DNA_ID= /DNA_START= /DNA_END= /DNA_ORIENTATION=